ncbi:transcription factor domain-containing protein [Aspergillus lucknowensis]|uniref:Fungal-specific transcription factor domain-containing protein n=1 Tax=Aspergillus lucknowensis TaxID=176173 RepID=A0ABR4LRU1_9EURO
MPPHRPPRKACDLCYRKKIKCDAHLQRPRCSHCVVYDSPCTFEAASRKHRARKHPEAPSSEQSQIKQLEENLSQALAKIDQLESSRNVPMSSDAPSGMILAGLQEPEPEPEEEEQGKIFDVVDGWSPSPSPLDLPPLHEALPVVEKYLATLNSVIPLFHPGRLLNSLRDLYAPRSQRHCATWAAINVVLALAHSSHAPFDRHKAAHYLNRAQARLTEIIMGDADTINVQVLLGLAMLFQGARNLKPAAMITAIALRLAHELGLHARGRSEGLNASAILERNRVFWIAYIIDRDISMRTGQPPVQLETDIDIDLPPDDPEDGAGLVFAPDHSSRFNYFRARVQLATIQWKVYEAMYSVRAQSLDVHQRNENLAELRHMLDDWASQIPPQFRPNAVLRTYGPDSLRSFGILYSSHLSCRALICRAHAMETPWLQSLQEFGRKSLQRRITEPVVLPQGWQVLVNESREYMRLFMGVERKDPAFIWMTGCTYITGSICLIANNMLYPTYETWRYDQSLAESSLPLLEEMIQQEPYEPLKKIQNACCQLLQLAYNISLQNNSFHF